MRIIAGTAKGRKLLTPATLAIRPTADRVRESLFNILAGRIVEARFLDLFCGVGANGIEALSRGAAHATFMDADKDALSFTRRNLETCRFTEKSRCLRGRLPEDLRAPGAPFDILFADPPYAYKHYEALLDALTVPTFRAPDSLIVIETDRACILPDQVGSLRLADRRIYGNTALTFFS